MKISSSTVEYTSSHFLGTQERDNEYMSTDGGSIHQQSIHAVEQQDAAYDVQLTGKDAQQAGVDASKGIYQEVKGNGGATNIQAVSDAELAKLSPEDRQKVQMVQNYVGLMTGGKLKVVLTPEEEKKAQLEYANVEREAVRQEASGVAQVQVGNAGVEVNLNARIMTESQEAKGTITSNEGQLSSSFHSEKTTDIAEATVKIDTRNNEGIINRWKTVGTITENSQSIAVGRESFVLGQNQGAVAEATAGVVQAANAPGTITYVGDTPVVTPYLNDNGRPSGIRVGNQYSTSQQITEEEYTAWSEKGTIQTEDGRIINLDKTSLMTRTAELNRSQTIANIDDPLVIQYGKGNIGLTDKKYSFDLNADGQQDGISFVKPGAGFLALDANGDGKINDGTELFGTKSGNGFKDLSNYDKDSNGWIDENDGVYNKLRIWSKDDNGNDQLMTLKEAGVGAIYLGSISTEFAMKDQENNLQGQVRQSGFFLKEDGTAGTVQQIDLVRGKDPTVEQPGADRRLPPDASADAQSSVQASKHIEVAINENSTITAEIVNGGIILKNKNVPVIQAELHFQAGGQVAPFKFSPAEYKTLSSIEQYRASSERGRIYNADGIINYNQSSSEYDSLQVALTKNSIKVSDYHESQTTSTFAINSRSVNHFSGQKERSDSLLAEQFMQVATFTATMNLFKNIFGVKKTMKNSDLVKGTTSANEAALSSTVEKTKTFTPKREATAKIKGSHDEAAAHSFAISHKNTNNMKKPIDLRL